MVCYCCEPRYKCLSTGCVRDPTGPYTTLSGCEAACPVTRYKCISTGCVVDSTGPYTSFASCRADCPGETRYECRPTGCVVSADYTGPYTTFAACQAACPTDPACSSTACPDGLSAASGELPAAANGGSISGAAVTVSGSGARIVRNYFSTATAVSAITVNYEAGCFPNRFQLWAPQCGQSGNLIAERVLKRDSDYRGQDDNVAVGGVQTCGERKAASDPPCTQVAQGGPTGSFTWNKPAGITCVEIAVISPCEEAGEVGPESPLPAWQYTIQSVSANPAP